MTFPSGQLHRMEHSKPLVQTDDSDEWIQWDYCDLEGLPPERLPGSMTNMGKIPKGQDGVVNVITTSTFFSSSISTEYTNPKSQIFCGISGSYIVLQTSTMSLCNTLLFTFHHPNCFGKPS